MTEANQPHVARRTLREAVMYPAHGPREDDSHYGIFHAARKHLIDALGVGCWIGGATKQGLATGLAVEHQCHGAKQLEAHHNVGEFAALSAMDWQKVAADFPQLGIHSDEDFLAAAESDGGLRILCDKHHRGPNHGIHMVTEPVWKLDRYNSSGWEFLPDAS